MKFHIISFQIFMSTAYGNTEGLEKAISRSRSAHVTAHYQCVHYILLCNVSALCSADMIVDTLIGTVIALG